MQGIKGMDKKMDIPKMSPMVHLDVNDLPAIKDWKVGGDYKILLNVKQTSEMKDEMGHSAGFKIKKATAYSEHEIDNAMKRK